MKQRRTVNTCGKWVQYEVRRHAVAELESLLGAGVGPPAPSSNAGAGVVEEAVPAPGAEHWRLAKTPRNMEALVESLCQEESRFVSPFGDDLVAVPHGHKAQWRRMPP